MLSRLTAHSKAAFAKTLISEMCLPFIFRKTRHNTSTKSPFLVVKNWCKEIISLFNSTLLFLNCCLYLPSSSKPNFHTRKWHWFAYIIYLLCIVISSSKTTLDPSIFFLHSLYLIHSTTNTWELDFISISFSNLPSSSCELFPALLIWLLLPACFLMFCYWFQTTSRNCFTVGFSSHTFSFLLLLSPILILGLLWVTCSLSFKLSFLKFSIILNIFIILFLPGSMTILMHYVHRSCGHSWRCMWRPYKWL